MTAPSRRPLVQKTAWSLAASVSTALGGVATSVVVARALGPAGTGRVAFVTWLAVTAGVVASLGLPACLQRYVAELHGAGRDADAAALGRRLVRALLGVALATAAAGAAAAWTFAPAADRSLYLALAGLLLLQMAGDACRGYLAGMQQFPRAARLAVVGSVVQVAATAGGALVAGVPGALAGIAAGMAVPALVAVRIALGGDAGAPLDAALRARLRSFAVDTYLAALVSTMVWSRLEVAFLEPSWGERGVAMFTVALALATLASQGGVLLAGALLPHMAERAAAGDEDNVRRTYASATRILGALVLPLCFGAAALAPPLVPLAWGAGFRDAAAAAAVLCPFAAAGAVASAGSSLLYARERTRFIFVGGLAGAAMAVAGMAIVIPAHGPLGAAWVRGAVQTSMVALGTWYIVRRLGVPAPFGSLVRSTVAAGLCAAAAAACVLFLPPLPGVAAGLAAGAAVYLVAARALRALEGDDVRMLHNAVALLPAALRPPAAGVVRFVAGPRPA